MGDGAVGLMRTVLTIAAVITVWTLGLYFGHAALAQGDRSAMFPPRAPLWGKTTDGREAVLWSEGGRMFNSNPADPLYARSHWDEIAWEGQWLVYRATEAVAPLEPKRIEFAEGIRYMPRSGDKFWHGSTRFSSEAGDGLCVYAASTYGNQMRIDELLLWDNGDVTTWDESYEFSDAGLVRAWGGNATGADRWDITFTP